MRLNHGELVSCTQGFTGFGENLFGRAGSGILVNFFYCLVRKSKLAHFRYLSSQGKQKRVRSSVLVLHCSKLHASEEIRLNKGFF